MKIEFDKVPVGVEFSIGFHKYLRIEPENLKNAVKINETCKGQLFRFSKNDSVEVEKHPNTTTFSSLADGDRFYLVDFTKEPNVNTQIVFQKIRRFDDKSASRAFNAIYWTDDLHVLDLRDHAEVIKIDEPDGVKFKDVKVNERFTYNNPDYQFVKLTDAAEYNCLSFHKGKKQGKAYIHGDTKVKVINVP